VRNIGLASELASPEERARLRTEAEALARLSHPNIVQVHHVGEHDGRLFFSMEYCAGGTLAQRLAGTPLPPAAAARLTETLARAVQAAHDCQVIHRDLKPANVLLAGPAGSASAPGGIADVSSWGTPKVSDFGLARKLDESAQTASGALLGTPSYMAPEQARGRNKEVGPATDVYALGAILYELLTGRPPFKGASTHETLAQVCQDEPVPVRRLQPRVPRDLETVCLKCLHKDPRRRYPSAAELADDLERFQAGKPVRARRAGRPERAVKWARRNPAVAGLLVVLAAATAVSTLFALEARRQAASESQARTRTRAALDEMSSQVIDDWLSKREGPLEPAQRDFLHKALAYYEEFAKESGHTEEARQGVAGAHLRVGDIRRRLGEHEAAEVAFRRGQDIYADLAADYPAVPQYRQGWASTYFVLGTLLEDTGRLREAEAAYGDSLALLKRLAADYPAVPEYRLDLARSHNALGTLLKDTGRPKEAEVAYRDALAIQKPLAAEFPAVPQYRHFLGVFNLNLGHLLTNAGRARDAEVALSDALDLLKRLVTDFPTVPEYRQTLARIQNGLGGLLAETGRPKGPRQPSATPWPSRSN
jgi:tetratricopeptide (TPR) repeat protein